jgi:hypothetical protein
MMFDIEKWHHASKARLLQCRFLINANRRCQAFSRHSRSVSTPPDKAIFVGSQAESTVPMELELDLPQYRRHSQASRRDQLKGLGTDATHMAVAAGSIVKGFDVIDDAGAGQLMCIGLSSWYEHFFLPTSFFMMQCAGSRTDSTATVNQSDGRGLYCCVTSGMTTDSSQELPRSIIEDHGVAKYLPVAS